MLIIFYGFSTAWINFKSPRSERSCPYQFDFCTDLNITYLKLGVRLTCTILLLIKQFNEVMKQVSHSVGLLIAYTTVPHLTCHAPYWLLPPHIIKIKLFLRSWLLRNPWLRSKQRSKLVNWINLYSLTTFW